jgi:hypothetical protein
MLRINASWKKPQGMDSRCSITHSWNLILLHMRDICQGDSACNTKYGAGINVDHGNLPDEFFCRARQFVEKHDECKELDARIKNPKGMLISVGRSGRKAEDKWDYYINKETRIRMISEENSL